MSRNLGSTRCDFCGAQVKLDEPPRQITREDCGNYYDMREGYSFAGMICANASCPECGAKYLAWIDLSARSGPCGFLDLSFRSTFNDEPGPEDKPDIQRRRKVRYGTSASSVMRTCAAAFDEPIDLAKGVTLTQEQVDSADKPVMVLLVEQPCSLDNGPYEYSGPGEPLRRPADWWTP